MPRIALLHTNREYATSLASAVGDFDCDYKTDIISRVPVSERIRYLLGRDYDLIQTDELMVNGVLGTGASLISDVPLVTCIRGWADYTNAHRQYGPVKNAGIRARSQLVLRRSSATVFISGVTRREFTSMYDVNEDIVIGRTIDTNAYVTNNVDRRSEETFDVLTITNLRYEEKLEGIKTILRGLTDLFEQRTDLRYRVAGGGAYLDDLRAFVDEYPYGDRVDILGFRDDVGRLLAHSDLFVYVSYLDSFGTVVLEAQAAGLPVIAGDSSGIPDALGDAGLLCEPTADGVTDAVGRVLSDESFQKELANRSRERMRTYNEECARDHVAVWNRVLGRD